MHRQHRSRTWDSQYRRRTTPSGLSGEPVGSNSSRRQGPHRTRPSRLGTTSSDLQRQQQASSQSAAAALACPAILHLNGLVPSLQPSAGRPWALRSAGREPGGGGVLEYVSLTPPAAQPASNHTDAIVGRERPNSRTRAFRTPSALGTPSRSERQAGRVRRRGVRGRPLRPGQPGAQESSCVA